MRDPQNSTETRLRPDLKLSDSIDWELAGELSVRVLNALRRGSYDLEPLETIVDFLSLDAAAFVDNASGLGAKSFQEIVACQQLLREHLTRPRRCRWGQEYYHELLAQPPGAVPFEERIVAKDRTFNCTYSMSPCGWGDGDRIPSGPPQSAPEDDSAPAGGTAQSEPEAAPEAVHADVVSTILSVTSHAVLDAAINLLRTATRPSSHSATALVNAAALDQLVSAVARATPPAPPLERDYPAPGDVVGQREPDGSMSISTFSDERRCIACGNRVADSEWCLETRDGDHRPAKEDS